VTELSTAKNTDEKTIISEMESLFPSKKAESTDDSDNSD
jgi:hypothetical protein